ncbi:hypothetical protein ACIPV2_09490 [Microbacterium sp. NPDC089987]|uniref:hypothetical protein n=1 Tax=Microbacterium sp. NPDC089987 TaxID=3364202 RepID=UPI0037F6718D
MNDDMSAEEIGTEELGHRDEGTEDADTSGRSGGGDHPSQAEGEDPDNPTTRPDPDTTGHPSPAEG